MHVLVSTTGKWAADHGSLSHGSHYNSPSNLESQDLGPISNAWVERISDWQ